jgi:hypothetical protein
MRFPRLGLENAVCVRDIFRGTDFSPFERCTFISQGPQMQGIKIFAGGAGDVRKGNGTAEDKSQTI